MRVTNPEDIKKLKDNPYTYEDLIIMPDGEIINANYGHVSKRAAVGMNRTKAQKDVYEELVRNRIVNSNYYDIAEERKIAEQFYH